MTSKTIIIGLVALAFVAGSIVTESTVFANKDDAKGNSGIIGALQSIADAINGIESNVTVEPTVNVEVPPAEVQIIGIEGPPGPEGPPGSQAEFFENSTLYAADHLVLVSEQAQNTSVSCGDPTNEIAVFGGWNLSHNPDIVVVFQRIINNSPNQVEYNVNVINTGNTATLISVFVECIPK